MDASPPAPALQLTPGVELRASLLPFLALLPVGAEELDRRVAEAVATNPVLEREPGGFCPHCGQYAVGGRCPGCLTTRLPAEPVAARDWREALLADARLEAAPSQLQALAVLVASLDDHGLLTSAPPLADADRDGALAVLRRVGPPGIAASSPVDCVRVQVQALVAAGVLPPLTEVLVSDHLDRVAGGRLDEVAEALDVGEREVHTLLEGLRAHTTPYVVLDGDDRPAPPTDVVFRRDPGAAAGVRADVLDPSGYGVRLVDDLGDGSRDAAEWLRPHVREARQLLDAIAARSTMLRRVCELLATEQTAWILHRSDHRHLRRSQVAQQLGVHPSTVGRAIDGKSARLPDGAVVPLGSFFGGAASHLQQVADALARHPEATDAELSRDLAAAGTPLARRTVAKYRAQLRAAGPYVPKPASPPG